MLEYIPIISYAIAGIAALSIAFVVFRSNTIKATNEINQNNIKALKDQNEIQAGEIKAIQDDKIKLNEQVSVLSGKVDTLSKIPLAKIEQHMADTNRILQAVLPLLDKKTTEQTTISTTKVTS